MDLAKLTAPRALPTRNRAVLHVAALAFGVTLALLAPTSATAETAPLKPVKLLPITQTDIVNTRQFFGQVVARQSVDLAFQVGGQINRFPVIEGALIEEGTLVAELDLESFTLALEQAELQREQAARTLARLEQLSGSSASQVRIDDARTALDLAKVAEANARYALDHATLHAPFDSLVAARNIANYTTVGAGTPVVRLHDMSEIRIEVDVPEVLFLNAAPSPAMEIVARFPSSDRLFPLTLREYKAEATAIGQAYRVTLGMTPPEDIRVLPGASATVIVNLAAPDTTGTVVPESAVFVDSNSQPSVFTFAATDSDANPDVGTVTKHAVTIAPAPQAKGILITDGLPASGELVATGGHALTDGQTVRRFTGFGN